MTPEERVPLIKRYQDGHAAFINALSAIPEAALDFAPPGEWSTREIVHHVADAELVRGYRLRQLLAEDAPRIQGFNELQFVARLHYYRPVQVSLSLYKAAVDSNLELLTLMLPEDWVRAGKHEEFGSFSVEDWLRRAATHSFDHAEQLRKLAST